MLLDKFVGGLVDVDVGGHKESDSAVALTNNLMLNLTGAGQAQ
jgi:hypothetical protein